MGSAMFAAGSVRVEVSRIDGVSSMLFTFFYAAIFVVTQSKFLAAGMIEPILTPRKRSR